MGGWAIGINFYLIPDPECPEDAGNRLVTVDIPLTAEEALMLADRLTRAAHLILESGEGLPSVDRDYQRYTWKYPDDD